jgi:hypothetical protein
MTEVELELAKADMAFLIAKEKESGDWDKWQDSQRNWTGRPDLGPAWDGIPVQPAINSGAIIRRSRGRRDE